MRQLDRRHRLTAELLSVLARASGPLTPGEIAEHVKARDSSIYRALRTMDDQGLIRDTRRKSRGAYRYSITERGRATLSEAQRRGLVQYFGQQTIEGTT